MSAPQTGPRGAVALALVLALVLLELAVVAVAIAAARQATLAPGRTAATRAAFGAESAARLAAKELLDNADHDADGGIGSISADANAANDPLVAGTRVWATRATDAGTGDVIITAKGLRDGIERTVAITAEGGAGSAGVPLVAYADNATSSTVRTRVWSAGGFDAAIAAGTLSAAMNQVDLAQSPTGEQALVTTNASGMVSLRSRPSTGGTWTLDGVIGGSGGTPYGPVAAVEYERLTGDLLAVYRVTSNTAPRFRTRIGGVVSGESTVSLGFTTAPEEIRLVARPNSNEILLIARASNVVAAALWNGTAFGAPVTISSLSHTSGFRFAAAFESVSGDGLIVWSTGTGLSFRTITGSTFASAQSVTTTSGTIFVVRLAPSPVSDAMVAAFSTSAGAVIAVPWTGSAFGSASTIDPSDGHIGPNPLFDLAWEPSGARAVLTWFRRTAGAIPRTTTWNGSAWSTAVTSTGLAQSARSVRLMPGVSASQVVAVAHLAAASSTIDDYTIFGKSGLAMGSATTSGLAGGNIAGINLPAAPSATHGSTNQSYGNSQTVTITPGSYGDYSFGNACVVNLSSGTYRFKTFDVGGRNTLTLNADTAGGNITFILANGNFEPGNNLVINATGGGAIVMEIVNGNFSAGSSPVLTGVHVRAYNGNLQFGSSATAFGSFWASSNVNLTSGTIHPHASASSGSGALVAIPIAAGVAGTTVTVSSAARASPLWQSYDLNTPPSGGGYTILDWAVSWP